MSEGNVATLLPQELSARISALIGSRRRAHRVTARRNLEGAPFSLLQQSSNGFRSGE
jgi:hypothetical protein